MNTLKGSELYELADEILMSVVCDEVKLKRLKQIYSKLGFSNKQ